MKTTKLRSSRLQRGITLMESLVSLVVLALGVLGLIGFQLQTLRDARDSVGRSRAIVAIQDVAERMRLNPTDMANYNLAFGVAPPAGPDCLAATCTTTQLTAYDLRRWRQNVADALPGGQSAIAVSPSDARQFAVVVGWIENRADVSTQGDAPGSRSNPTKSNTGAGSMVIPGGAITCPAGLTCHLVYVQPFL